MHISVSFGNTRTSISITYILGYNKNPIFWSSEKGLPEVVAFSIGVILTYSSFWDVYFDILKFVKVLKPWQKTKFDVTFRLLSRFCNFSTKKITKFNKKINGKGFLSISLKWIQIRMSSLPWYLLYESINLVARATICPQSPVGGFIV